MYIIKRTQKKIHAYCLGQSSNMERRLVAEGKIRVLQNGQYELFSQESVNGCGEIASAGDYFKMDSDGFPYPNEREWFLKNHEHMGGDEFLQLSTPLKAWTVEEPMSDEIRFLVEQRRLSITPSDPERYFSAFLWGARLSAKKDAVIVFYRVEISQDGSIKDVEFNFVARTEFDKTYQIIEGINQD